MLRSAARRFVLITVALSAITAAHRASAEETATSIWYRSGEGCPDGDAFLAKVASRGVTARLAQVGDPIDFVVTLGNDEKGSKGSLERQARTGTVAVRRVEGDNCDQVADALALSVALARDESAHEQTATQKQAEEQASEDRQDATPITARPTAGPAGPVTDMHPIARDESPTLTRSVRKEPHTYWLLGAQGSVTTGVAPMILPGIGLFLELDPRSPSRVLTPAFRLTALGAVASGKVEGTDIRAQLLAARMEGCPARFGNGAIGAAFQLF